MPQKGDNLEDLVSQLSQQVQKSDWLQQNTPEKWISENKELHKEMQDELKRIEKEREEKK